MENSEDSENSRGKLGYLPLPHSFSTLSLHWFWHCFLLKLCSVDFGSLGISSSSDLTVRTKQLPLGSSFCAPPSLSSPSCLDRLLSLFPSAGSSPNQCVHPSGPSLHRKEVVWDLTCLQRNPLLPWGKRKPAVSRWRKHLLLPSMSPNYASVNQADLEIQNTWLTRFIKGMSYTAGGIQK